MNEYRDTFSSLLRFCTDFTLDMQGLGYDLEVINFDAAGEAQTWPKKDVVGLGEFNFELDDGFIMVQAVFAVSTYEDTNNFRLNEQMNQILNRLLPGGRIKLFDGSSGRQRGFLVVRNGTRVAPPLSSQTRTVQPVMVSLISDQTLRA